MTSEVTNLVPEQRWGIRAEKTGMRAGIGALDDEMAEVEHARLGPTHLLAHAMGRLRDVEVRAVRPEAR